MSPRNPGHTNLVEDRKLIEVKAALDAKTDLLGVVGRALRKAFDEVIDGSRTGRYCVDQLEKTEKTYIGTKVEIVLRADLELARGRVLDNLIAGHEVDTKFSIKGDWMIPREAFGELCLLVEADDYAATFRLGLMRMTLDVLTNGSNQDGKKTVSAEGKKKITWLVEGGMPKNFLLGLPDATRDTILKQSSGRQRIRALFRNVTHQLIPRSVIEQVAQQRDPLKRAREMKALLAPEGFQILCATYASDRAEMMRYGFDDVGKDDWLSERHGI